jgi:glycosyltransferase involved in cell wall biosynthesis
MILFIGNMLSSHGLSPAMSELLAIKLAKDFELKKISTKRNMFVRIVDMLSQIVWYRNLCKFVILDVFSSRAFWYAVTCAWLLRKLQIPYITILRGGGLPDRIRKNPSMSNLVFKQAYANISPSSYLARNFKTYGYPVNIIPNFIDLERYVFRHRVDVKPRLLWVRSFHTIYNPMLAIKILELVREVYPEASLCMVGPDKDGSRKIVEELAVSKGLSHLVEFTGKLSKSEWITKSASFDIFINTTDYDNMPVSVLEAMALGFPVISTNVGGVPDLIQDEQNGLLVIPNDAKEFTTKILALLEKPELAASLSASARVFAESYAWEKVKPHWVHLLTKNQQ